MPLLLPLSRAVRCAAAAPRLAAAAPAAARNIPMSAASPFAQPIRRNFFVRVSYPSNASRDFERLQSKFEASGWERVLKERSRYMKPHLVRQKNAKDAVYNRAKRERIRIVEELLLDRKGGQPF